MANIKVGPKEEERAVRWYTAGKTATEIAHLLKVDVETVTKALKRRGVDVHRGPRRQVTDAVRMRMVELYGQGLGHNQIGGMLGVNGSTVARYLRAAGVEMRPAGFQRGEAHSGWNGGRTINSTGYAMVRLYPDDPFFYMAAEKAEGASYCLEHRLVMARHLGRPLADHESVHHIDGNRQNNDISNLQLRRGKHGKGSAFRCLDCGSHNVEPVPLAPPPVGN